MTKLKKFFILSSSDLDENYMGATEIAEQMKPANSNTLRLPRSFANIMREIEDIDSNENN